MLCPTPYPNYPTSINKRVKIALPFSYNHSLQKAHMPDLPLHTIQPPFPSTSNPTPNSPPIVLTAEQEMELAAIPERYHARIVKILATNAYVEANPDHTAPIVVNRITSLPIETVKEAWTEAINLEFLEKEDLKAHPVAKAVGRPRRDGLPAGSIVKNKNAEAWNAYIAECQARKLKIAELKAVIRNQKDVLTVDQVVFNAWCLEWEKKFALRAKEIRDAAENTIRAERVQFDAWIASKTPEGYTTKASAEIQLQNLLENPVPRPSKG